MSKTNMLIISILATSCGGVEYSTHQTEPTNPIEFNATSILIGQPERGKGTSLGVHIDAIALEKKDGRILYANKIIKSRQIASAYGKTPPEAVLGEPDSTSGCYPEQTFHLTWTGFVQVSFFNSGDMVEEISNEDAIHIYLATDNGDLCSRSEVAYDVFAISNQEKIVLLCSSTKSTTCSMKDGVVTERSNHEYINHSEPTRRIIPNSGFSADADFVP